MTSPLCPYCGAYSKSQCDWDGLDHGAPRDLAPCEENDWEGDDDYDDFDEPDRDEDLDEEEY